MGQKSSRQKSSRSRRAPQIRGGNRDEENADMAIDMIHSSLVEISLQSREAQDLRRMSHRLGNNIQYANTITRKVQETVRLGLIRDVQTGEELEWPTNFAQIDPRTLLSWIALVTATMREIVHAGFIRNGPVEWSDAMIVALEEFVSQYNDFADTLQSLWTSPKSAADEKEERLMYSVSTMMAIAGDPLKPNSGSLIAMMMTARKARTGMKAMISVAAMTILGKAFYNVILPLNSRIQDPQTRYGTWARVDNMFSSYPPIMRVAKLIAPPYHYGPRDEGGVLYRLQQKYANPYNAALEAVYKTTNLAIDQLVPSYELGVVELDSYMLSTIRLAITFILFFVGWRCVSYIQKRLKNRPLHLKAVREPHGYACTTSKECSPIFSWFVASDLKKKGMAWDDFETCYRHCAPPARSMVMVPSAPPLPKPKKTISKATKRAKSPKPKNRAKSPKPKPKNRAK